MCWQLQLHVLLDVRDVAGDACGCVEHYGYWRHDGRDDVGAAGGHDQRVEGGLVKSDSL